MPRIERSLYYKVAGRIFRKIYPGCKVESNRILIYKQKRRIYVEVAGKKLPYTGYGMEIFRWETWVKPERLNKIETEARKYDAEGWIAFCYAIQDEGYKKDFTTTEMLDGEIFGIKTIRITDYRKHMQSRSPLLGGVELPRKMVPQILYDPENI